MQNELAQSLEVLCSTWEPELEFVVATEQSPDSNRSSGAAFNCKDRKVSHRAAEPAEARVSHRAVAHVQVSQVSQRQKRGGCLVIDGAPAMHSQKSQKNARNTPASSMKLSAAGCKGTPPKGNVYLESKLVRCICAWG